MRKHVQSQLRTNRLFSLQQVCCERFFIKLEHTQEFVSVSSTISYYSTIFGFSIIFRGGLRVNLRLNEICHDHETGNCFLFFFSIFLDCTHIDLITFRKTKTFTKLNFFQVSHF